MVMLAYKGSYHFFTCVTDYINLFETGMVANLLLLMKQFHLIAGSPTLALPP